MKYNRESCEGLWSHECPHALACCRNRCI